MMKRIVPAKQIRKISSRVHHAQAACRERSVSARDIALAGLALLATFIWAFSQQIMLLANTWETEPDYAHGYLVVPIAIFFLWARRASYPGANDGPGFAGLSLVVVGVALIIAGRRYFLMPVANWGLIAWVAGTCWLILGRKALVWALPSVLFLFFMVPLPYSAENVLSIPLRRVATTISCWGLQLLGQPATSDGFTILLESTRLEIEAACSGLRMLVMIAALTAVYWVLVCRNWTERAFLTICIVPVALFANSLRIIFAALSFRYFPDQEVAVHAHELIGWIVAPAAALSLALALAYFRHLLIEKEVGLTHSIDNCAELETANFKLPRRFAT